LQLTADILAQLQMENLSSNSFEKCC